jgi:hypothetical protein
MKRGRSLRIMVIRVRIKAREINPGARVALGASGNAVFAE